MVFLIFQCLKKRTYIPDVSARLFSSEINVDKLILGGNASDIEARKYFFFFIMNVRLWNNVYAHRFKQSLEMEKSYGSVKYVSLNIAFIIKLCFSCPETILSGKAPLFCPQAFYSQQS